MTISSRKSSGAAVYKSSTRSGRQNQSHATLSDAVGGISSGYQSIVPSFRPMVAPNIILRHDRRSSMRSLSVTSPIETRRTILLESDGIMGRMHANGKQEL